VLIGFADEDMPMDCAPVKGGVLRSFLTTAGEVMAFLGRFLLRDFCFDPFSRAVEFNMFWEADWLFLFGVRGGVVGWVGAIDVNVSMLLLGWEFCACACMLRWCGF